MIILIIWAIVLIAIVVLNARFWKIFPDQYDDEAEVKKRQIKPLFEPYKVPLSHEISYWASLLTLLAAIGAVVWMVCNAI